MFPLYVFPKSHLQEGEPHVQGLDDVALSGQWVVPASRLSSRHLTLKLDGLELDNRKDLTDLDGLEPDQHVVLESLESGVQSSRAELIQSSAD